MISPISSDLCLSFAQLYHLLRTRSYVIPFNLSMQSSWVKAGCSIHRVLHTPSTAYTEYCIHRVLHHPKIDCLLPPASSHLSADPVVLNALHSQDFELPNELSLSCRCTSLPIYRLEIDYLKVLLQSRSMMAPKCIYKHAGLRPSSAQDHGMQVHVSKVARSRCNGGT